MNTDRHTFKGKRKVGRTEISDFTDYQGIGHDPLYKRYKSVQSVFARLVSAEYAHFLAAPDYSPIEDTVNWYIDDWNETPRRLVDLTGAERARYETVRRQTVDAVRKAVDTASGEDLQVMMRASRYIDDEFIYCCDGRVYLVAWGMTPDRTKHVSTGQLVHESPTVEECEVRFDAGEHGRMARHEHDVIRVARGTELTANDVPRLEVDSDWELARWSPEPVGLTIDADTVITAMYRGVYVPPIIDEPDPEPDEPDSVVTFDGGGHGKLEGNLSIVVPRGECLSEADVPRVTPDRHYKFKCWSENPVGLVPDGDMTVTAMYDEDLPWYLRLWHWFCRTGWKWLLGLLALLLLAWLLSVLLKDCKGCTRADDIVPATDVDVVDDVPTIVGDDGVVIDDNRPVDGAVVIVDDRVVSEGRLPDAGYVVAPVYGDEVLPIVDSTGDAPVRIAANRLFFFLEDENDDIDAFAADFKRAYPGSQYKIIGYDREVKSMVVQIPEAERDQIRQSAAERIPNHRFIVFDEQIYELNVALTTTKETPGWHLEAVGAQQSWKISKGKADVVVAIIDDGIESSHPMFKGRIIKPYNVFNQSSRLSAGQGHGTHVAGLAVGSHDYLAKGAAGMAPDCKIMPVQVFDNGKCPLSALVSGIMYAVHNGANVVNVSIGPSIPQLADLPVEQQRVIAEREFKNVERLWNRVCQLAAKKNAIIVFAAGNEMILSQILPENRTRNAITVGAVDSRRRQTSFSNYGIPGTDVSAPGTGINSAFPKSALAQHDGTSMAAPIVSGIIAQMKALKPDLTVEQAYNVLYRTGSDVYGDLPPMVRADRALDAVKKGDFSRGPDRPGLPMTDNKRPAAEAAASPEAGTDYDDIRCQIAEHQREIDRLKKLLP